MKYTIFFDLGNVLIFFDHGQMCRQVANYSGLAESVVQEIMLKYGDLYERGHVNSRQIYDEICKIAGKSLDFDTLMHAVSNIFSPNEKSFRFFINLRKKDTGFFFCPTPAKPILHLRPPYSLLSRNSMGMSFRMRWERANLK